MRTPLLAVANVLVLCTACAEALVWYEADNERVEAEGEDVQSIEFDGNPVLPPIFPQYICVLDSRMQKAADKAIYWWNELFAQECPVFDYAGDALCTITLDFGETEPNDLGNAYMHFSNNMMTKTDIVLADYEVWDGTHLQAVIAHELGHALGLADEEECNGRSLMCHVIPTRYGLLNTDAEWIDSNFHCIE